MAHILVVDDEAAIRDLVRIVLTRDGHTVVEAFDGVAALDCVERERPDLIVLDVRMPRMDGVETLGHLKANPATSGVPVVIVSAFAVDKEGREYLEAGAASYLAKPFPPKALAARVREILSSYT